MFRAGLMGAALGALGGVIFMVAVIASKQIYDLIHDIISAGYGVFIGGAVEIAVAGFLVGAMFYFFAGRLRGCDLHNEEE